MGAEFLTIKRILGVSKEINMLHPVNYHPVTELRPFISGYGVIEVPEGVTVPYFSPPLGRSGFIIQTTNTQDRVIARIGDRDHFTHQAVATGQVTTPVHGELVGELRSFLVFFQPTGMHQLFGSDMAPLTDSAVPITEILGSDQADTLINSLKSETSIEKQIEILNLFFRDVQPEVSSIGKMEMVLSYIHERKGNVTVAELLKHGHYHRRTLERQFLKMIGLTPKVYAQIYRFKCLMAILESTPEITWTQLSEKAGFYDQAHMSRYVREYLQVSPNNIVTLNVDFINFLLGH